MFWGFASLCVLAASAVGGLALPSSVLLAERESSDVQKCIDLSTSSPRWEITNLDFTTINYNTGGRMGDIRFNAYNPAVDTNTACTASDIDMSGSSTAWHDCSVAGTGFQFSLSDFGLHVKGNWTCGGEQKKIFKGEGTISPAILQCDDYPYETRGWQTICRMDNGIIEAKLT
ncbi:hypothetical protein QBC47DRAFT_431801 [Echria macrotheca]|uniref:AA1-like domain-containing protein n=1 Tax=Echria macrotheca TaxID=438768 RepID=A0AAJ0B9Q9_9PEZI|nr:hypothetical protein QBC47DRAFT_431801 [Echria macrotheca]